MKTRIYPLLILLTVTALSSASASAAASTPRRQHEGRHEQPVPAAAVPQQAGTPLTGISSPDISAATSAANTSQTDTSRTETLQTDTPQAPPTDSAVLTGDFTGHRAAAIDTPVMDSLLAGGGTLLSSPSPIQRPATRQAPPPTGNASCPRAGGSTARSTVSVLYSSGKWPSG